MTAKKLSEKNKLPNASVDCNFLTWNGSRCAQLNVSLLNSLPTGVSSPLVGWRGVGTKLSFLFIKQLYFGVCHEKLLLGHTLIWNKGLSYSPKFCIFSLLHLVLRVGC